MAARLRGAALGALLVLWVQVASTLVDLDLQKISGFWREVGVASKYNVALKAGIKVEGLLITSSGHNVTVKAAYNSSGSCVTEKVVGSGRDAVGKLAFPGHREILVLDTDYEHYAILRVSLLWRGKEFHVFKYLTRSLDTEDEPGFWRFREMTADTGLYLVSRHRRCAKLLKEVSLRPSVCTEDPSPAQPSPDGSPLVLDPGQQGAIHPLSRTPSSTDGDSRDVSILWFGDSWGLQGGDPRLPDPPPAPLPRLSPVPSGRHCPTCDQRH